jgi:hypothetical protein
VLGAEGEVESRAEDGALTHDGDGAAGACAFFGGISKMSEHVGCECVSFVWACEDDEADFDAVVFFCFVSDHDW